MATCLNEVIPNMYKNLTLVDVMCPVCRGIFIEPVIMPCHHGLCLQCFERTMKETSLTCPMCRKRIGSWLRAATKDRNLVNNELWAIIQKRFPEQVQAKLSGADDGIEENVLGRGSTRISSPGQIRREFELHIRKLEEETQKKLEVERRATEDLIRTIQEEEERQYRAARQQLLDQTAADERIAKELQEESLQSTSQTDLSVREETSGPHVRMDNKENKSQARGGVGTEIKGPMDSYVISQQKSAVSSGKFLTTSDSSFSAKFGSSRLKTVPVTEMENARCASSMSTGSHDSINQEMHHFKPIKSVPRTPPKRLSDGRVLVPVVVKAVPVNLNTVYESLTEASETQSFFSTSFKQQLKLQVERMKTLKAELGTSEINPSVSAFRGKESFLQKTEAFKSGNDNSEREMITEDIESPRKKARKDIAVGGQKLNSALAGLSSYSDENCKGKKVIAIVHDQSDALMEVEANVGGHDRRFGCSDERDNCDFRLVEKVADRDESEDELKYDNPDVFRTTGIEPESHSQTPTEIRCKSTTLAMIGHESSSSGINLNMNLLSINNEKTLVNHCEDTRHPKQSKIKGVCNNNNNNDIKTAVKSNLHTETQASAVPEKRKDGSANIVPLVAEDASLVLSEEQTRIEMLIRQERSDFELALRLQQEWTAADRRVDRSKGSVLAYELRNSSKPRATKKKTAAKKEGRGRQSTLEESFTGALHSTRKR